MKKLLLFVLTVFCIQNAFANFDQTLNYQGKNVMTYLGQDLYVIPYRNAKNEITRYNKNLIAYVGFKDNLFKTDDSEFDRVKFYHYDPYFNGSGIGTEPQWLGGKTFRVVNIQKMDYYEHIWVFSLVNVNNPADKCKYIYHDSYVLAENQIDFPFVSLTYLQWLKSTYINNKVVIGTHIAMSNREKQGYSHMFFDRDIITGEKIIYNKDYEEYTVKDVIVHDSIMQLCFILQNSKHTISCPIGLIYEKNSPKRFATRIFLKSEWEYFCNKYGKSHMIAIMKGEFVEGMTLEELYMSRGSESTKTKIDNETIIYTWPNRQGKQVKTVVKNGKVCNNKTSTIIAQPQTDENVISSYGEVTNEFIKQTKKAASDYGKGIKSILGF